MDRSIEDAVGLLFDMARAIVDEAPEQMRAARSAADQLRLEPQPVDAASAPITAEQFRQLLNRLRPADSLLVRAHDPLGPAHGAAMPLEL